MGNALEIPIYNKVRQWCQDYGRPDVSDQHGAKDFIECETKESIRSLQVELIAMADGRFDEKRLDNILGARRRVKYGSYVEWAKMMLRWLGEAKGV